MQKIGSKRPQIPTDIFVRIVSIYFVPWKCKNINQWVDFFPREFEFSLIAVP